ncbi:MAG: hypothetical protein LBT21_07135 [Oscillospiraceae bacterium]|nr:hypothetical protein [Oscillospiraceae bacterium]
MRYENLPCPGCGQPLAAGEDIVTCPDCGAPQHRACWKQSGNCALIERHGGGFVWSPPESEPADEQSDTRLQSHINRWEEQAEPTPDPDGTDAQQHFFCPNCGRKNQGGSLQCENCGYLFFAPSAKHPAVPGTPQIWIAGQNDPLYVAPDKNLGGALAGDLALFIQRNARVYLHKFKKIAEDGKRVLFNWAAFVFRGYWFLYRKMYGIAGLFLLASLALFAFTARQLPSAAEQQDLLDKLAAMQQDVNAIAVGGEFWSTAADALRPYVLLIGGELALGLIAGFVSDRLYYSRATQIISALREKNRNEADFQFAALREGGVVYFQTGAAILLMLILQNLVEGFFAGRSI